MTNRQALAMTGIVKRFGPNLALDGVTLAVDHGEAVALLGENGAGKSTLLRVMTGELQPDAGAVTIHGVPTRLADPAHARALGIAVVHQEPEIFDSLSIAENLLLPHLGGRGLRSARVRRSSLTVRARHLLTEVGFGAELDPRKPAGELTPGLRQVLEIARALATRPHVLALDEPTASLSEREADRLFELVERLRDDGVGVVYVTHRLHEVERLCDRIVVLRDGRGVASRPRHDIDQDEMVRLMVGRERLTVHRRGAPGDPPIRLATHALSTERVDRVSLVVGAGEVVGVGGLVGSGRSAIVRAITGLDPIHGGEISMDGAPIRIRSVRDALAHGICLIPEDRKKQGLVNDRSIRENISLTASRLCSRCGWIDPQAERKLARKWIDELGIRASGVGQSVSTLSGGNQQKVVLARALAGAPKVLVLDEPTKGVDVGARAEIYRIIDELAQDGMSVLFVSSELPELLAVSDRILMVADGRIAGEVRGPEASEETLLAMVLRNAATGTPVVSADTKGVA